MALGMAKGKPPPSEVRGNLKPHSGERDISRLTSGSKQLPSVGKLCIGITYEMIVSVR
jgi:hypothetical protein